ncbi:helix-turn-helix transcriptional regulator [Lapidilactobacillus salsurivasis]
MFDPEINQYVYWEGKQRFLLEKDTDPQWIIYLIEYGSCNYKIQGQSGTASRGSVIICPPYVEFERCIKEKLTFHFFRFSFHGDSPYINSLPVILTDKQRILSTAAILCKFPYDTSSFSKEYRKTVLQDLIMLAIITNCNPVINQFNIPYKEPLIRDAINFLSEISNDDAISISKIADHLCITPSYFSRKFKSTTGYTPIEYRNMVRVRHAQKLLLETDWTLDDIAEKCGLSNGFYLSRLFSKYIGVCPQKYRILHQI